MRWKYRSDRVPDGINNEELILHLLRIRGIDETEKFINPGVEGLYSPYLLSDVKEASEKILKAIRDDRKITVYGDFDVDGITSTALLVLILEKLGARVDFYIPHRIDEGYGLNSDGIEEIKRKGTDLIITVDCGSNAVSEIELIEELDINLIITDHHIPESGKTADIFINPHFSENYPDELSGVGVVFKLCQALAEISDLSDNFLFWNLDLVALGTIADIIPLTGENRTLTFLGLKIMNEGRRPGIRAICDNGGLKGDITARDVSYLIGPRINALGRLEDASDGVRLLMTYDRKKAEEYAQNLEEHNSTRREIQREMYREAIELLEDYGNDRGAIVLSHPEWHEGLVGIVASKISEEFNKPAILIAEGDEMSKGSGRSIPSFNIMEGISEAAEFLERFGGHSQACGLSLKNKNIEKFSELFNEIVEEKLEDIDVAREMIIDFPLSLKKISRSLVKNMEKLAPFGHGNPEPVFSSKKKAKIVGSPRIVGADHLKMTVIEGDRYFKAIGFHMGEKISEISRGSGVEIAYTPEINDWSGKLSLIIKDLKVKK